MISATLPPFVSASDWDDVLEKSKEAVQCIADAASTIDEWLVAKAKECLLSTNLLVQWHQFLFQGVFPQFAGRVRNLSFPREVRFGDFNGVGFRLMDAELQKYEKTVHDLIDQLTYYQPSSEQDYREQVVRAASWSHADIVRIHPFLNGNGRAGRLIIDYYAYRYNLKPLGSGRPKTIDYVTAMNFYMKYRDSAQLYRFLLPLMVASAE